MTSIMLFAVGLSVGSFANVLSDKLANGGWPTGRSKCDHCGRVLSVRELVPVVSWLIQKGKSSCCKKRLSAQYPLVELAMAVVYVWFWFYLPSSPVLSSLSLGQAVVYVAAQLVILTCFVIILVTDMRYHIIPDVMTVVIVLCSLTLIWVQQGSFVEALQGALLLSGLLLALYVGTKGRGMGFGDVKFAVAMGLLLGPIDGFIALYIAFVTGGLFGMVALLLRAKKLKSTIAFGPFLVFGTSVMMFYGGYIWQVIKMVL